MPPIMFVPLVRMAMRRLIFTSKTTTAPKRAVRAPPLQPCHAHFLRSAGLVGDVRSGAEGYDRGSGEYTVAALWRLDRGVNGNAFSGRLSREPKCW